MTIDPAWLASTRFIDHDHPDVVAFADDAAAGAADPTTVAVRLFHAVRDGYRYDPYVIDYAPQAFRASTVVGSQRNWCTPKAILFTAAARHHRIPARLGFADVRNHLTSEKLSARMGTDLFAWHGYSELLLPDATGGRRWFKLSTAFNIELCDRFGVKVLDFDGTADALMHAFDQSGRRHMEYVRQRGSYADFPIDEVLTGFAEVYGNAFGEPRSGAAGAGDDAFA